MKTKILLFAVMLFAVAMTGCKKDDDNTFDYPMETLYGKWEGTYVKVDGAWMDITMFPKLGFSIQFNSDGSYYGAGYFGNGGGTYEASGKTINTYIDGEEYARYVIHSLSNTQAEATMYMGSSSMDIRVKKK